MLRSVASIPNNELLEWHQFGGGGVSEEPSSGKFDSWMPMPHGDGDQKLSITMRQAAECRKVHELK